MTTRGKPRQPGTQNPRSQKNAGTRGNRPDMVVSGAKDLSASEMAPERIAKLLARAGVASRREVERMIEQGCIKLNGKVLESPAVNVTLADTIEVNGEPLRGIERTRLWLYNKPAGLVTTNKDPEGRATVFDNLDASLPRVLSIGRLDINTEGLLLLTNDGGLARELELPSTGWLRRYRVRAHGTIDQAALDRLKDGIAVEGVLYGAIEATLDRTQGSNVWITMGLREGKNREIKNVLGALGLEVNRLIRISYGPFQLGDLRDRAVMEVKGRTLREQLGPRLIEKSGADFDAPIFNEQKPADDAAALDAKKQKPPAKSADRKNRTSERTPPGQDRPAKGPERPARDDRRPAKGSEWQTKGEQRTEPAGKRHESASDKRARNLDRLDTKPPEDKPRRPMRRDMSTNVWMGSGARPLGKKKRDAAEARAAEDANPKSGRAGPKREFGGAGKDRPSGKSFAKPAGRSVDRTDGKADKRGPHKSRPGHADRRR